MCVEVQAEVNKLVHWYCLEDLLIPSYKNELPLAYVAGANLATFLISLTQDTGHCMAVQLTGTIGTPKGPKATTTPSLFSAVDK